MPVYIRVNSLFLCNACFFCLSKPSTFFESSASKHPAVACSSPLTQCEREELRLRGGRVICLSPLWIWTWPRVGIKGFYMVCKAAFTDLFTPVMMARKVKSDDQHHAPRGKPGGGSGFLCISQAGSASRGGREGQVGVVLHLTDTPSTSSLRVLPPLPPLPDTVL